MKTSSPNRVRIIIPLAAMPLFKALDLGLAFKDQARKNNGKGYVFREDGSVQVCLEGLSNEHLDSLTTAYFEAVLKKGNEAVVTRCAFEGEFPSEIVIGECLHENLTRRLLHTLPIGALLVSGSVRDGSGKPFTASIGMRTDRQRLWEACEQAGAAQRKVWVVWRKEDANTITEGMQAPRSDI